MKKQIWQLAPCLTMIAMAGTVFAQDPPSRVARIAYMTGTVSFEPATVDQWTGASLNYPMTTGDNLYTDVNGARAVLRIGRNSIKLNSGTNFQFVNLSDQVVQFSINSGSVSVRVRRLFQGESWEVDTPNGPVTLLREGEYRIDTDPNKNATMVTSRTGDAEVTSNNQTFPVHARQTAYFSADGSPDIGDQNPNDAFDGFAYQRDRMEDVPAPQYVSQDLDGYEDLQANGSWDNNSQYGPIWRPRVEAGWAPYHNGHWAWVEPWGWSWVDDAQWGFAPFHYGRWAYVGNSWGWCPGPVNVRPVYAPALVAFVGGGGFGLSIGIGGGGGAVGWFPLGPRDPYIPSYQVSDAYRRNVNISNTRVTNINITNVNVTNVTYMNQSVPGAVVAMPQQAFSSAQPVQRSMVRVNPAQMQQVRVVAAAPVVPQRAAVLASGSGGRVVAPPANIASRPVMARLAPPPAPVSFAAKQQVLQQHPGVPVAPAQLQTIRRQAPPVVSAARPAVQAINTAQVRPVQPTVHPGAISGGFNAQRGGPPVNLTQPQRAGQPVVPPTQSRAPQPTPAAQLPQRVGQPPVAPAQNRPMQPAPAAQAPQRFGQPPVAPTQTRPVQPTPAAQPPQRFGQPPVAPTQTRPQQAAPPPTQPMRQVPPPVRTAPQEAQPVRPQPTPQAAPPMRQAAPPPARTVPQEQAPRPQYTPPVRQQTPPPVRESPTPAPRPVPQEARPQAPPPQRPQAAPPVREPAAQPQRQAPPPQVQRQAPPPQPQRQASPPAQRPAPQQHKEPTKEEEKKKE